MCWEEFPFPIQRIQTDRGDEFFGTPFQRALMDRAIKFRPIRPYSPHLNGKVERSQRTDRVEFYATIEQGDPEMESKLKEWQHFYNWIRPHGAMAASRRWSGTLSCNVKFRDLHLSVMKTRPSVARLSNEITLHLKITGSVAMLSINVYNA